LPQDTPCRPAGDALSFRRAAGGVVDAASGGSGRGGRDTDTCLGPPRFFRFTLAARLIDALALRRFMRRTKVALDAADNARLSEWQREHLLLTWCPIERAWKLEREVIAELRPPLNSAGNAAHAFYPRVHDARAEFRRRAATRAAGARGASPLALNRPFSGGVSFSRSGRKPKPPGRS
jgi:hypothetical protein